MNGLPQVAASPAVRGAYGLPAQIGPAQIGSAQIGPVLQTAPHKLTRPWLITIVDLITLLLSFFVLLFSMSKIEPARFKEVVRSYGDAFAPAQTDTGRLPRVTAAAMALSGWWRASHEPRNAV